MDTVFSLVVPELAGAPGADDLVRSVVDDLVKLEDHLSVFRPDSEVSRWRAGRLDQAEASPLLRQAIDACTRLEQLTDGAFSAWRDGRFDPTGYVKGWALARAAAGLESAGLTSFCLNGGGDVVVRGLGPNGRPWRIGLAHPYRPDRLASLVMAPPDYSGTLAVATSGTSQRGAHIEHPGDGWRPVDSSISVVGRDMALVDAVATAALAVGRDGSTASAELVRRCGLEAFGFGEDRRPWWTPGMPRYAALPG